MDGIFLGLFDGRVRERCDELLALVSLAIIIGDIDVSVNLKLHLFDF